MLLDQRRYLIEYIDGWSAKGCDDSIDMQGLDTEMNMGHAFTTDEAVPVLDLGYSGSGMDGDRLSLEQYNSRRLSGSSFTLSTTGALSEMPSYEDFSASL